MLQIAPPFDVEHLQRLYPATYQESMNTVLVQEALRYNALLEVVAASLKECTKAVKGLVVMSPSLESVCNSMYDNQVSDHVQVCQHFCRAAGVNSQVSFMQLLEMSKQSKPCHDGFLASMCMHRTLSILHRVAQQCINKDISLCPRHVYLCTALATLRVCLPNVSDHAVLRSANPHVNI